MKVRVSESAIPSSETLLVFIGSFPTIASMEEEISMGVVVYDNVMLKKTAKTILTVNKVAFKRPSSVILSIFISSRTFPCVKKSWKMTIKSRRNLIVQRVLMYSPSGTFESKRSEIQKEKRIRESTMPLKNKDPTASATKEIVLTTGDSL